MTATSPPTTMGSSLLFWLCISVGCTPCKEHENERTQFRWWLTQNNTLIAILIVVFIQCPGLCQGWHLQLESQIPRWVLFWPILIEASCSYTYLQPIPPTFFYTFFHSRWSFFFTIFPGGRHFWLKLLISGRRHLHDLHQHLEQPRQPLAKVFLALVI